MTNNENLEEDACLCALGAIPEMERDRIEASLSRDAAIGPLIQDLRSVAVTLALAASDEVKERPSPALKQRILDQIGGNPNQAAKEGFLSLLQARHAVWVPSGIPGCSRKVLSRNRHYQIVLAKMEPGARYPSHAHELSEDSYILEGDFRVHGEVLGPGDFHHAEAGSVHGEISTEHGCVCLIVSGVPSEPIPK